MRKLTPLLVLLALGCTEREAAPEAPSAAPVAVAPVVPPPAPEPPRLSEDELEFVLAPARAARENAGLTPLPLTLTDAEADGPVYDRVVDLLLAHLRVTRVRIGAHTDPRGSEQYNQRISQERAETVARELIERGIGCQRIEPVGFGESRPIEDAPMGAQRRIELTFVRVDDTAVDTLGADACRLSRRETSPE